MERGSWLVDLARDGTSQCTPSPMCIPAGTSLSFSKALSTMWINPVSCWACPARGKYDWIIRSSGDFCLRWDTSRAFPVAHRHGHGVGRGASVQSSILRVSHRRRSLGLHNFSCVPPQGGTSPIACRESLVNREGSFYEALNLATSVCPKRMTRRLAPGSRRSPRSSRADFPWSTTRILTVER